MRQRGRYVFGVIAAVVVLVASWLVAERRSSWGVEQNGRSPDTLAEPARRVRSRRNNPRLEKALSEMVEEAKTLAATRGVFTEVGSRERIEQMERMGQMGQKEPGEEDAQHNRQEPARPDLKPFCIEDADCSYPRGVCDTVRGLCRCVVAYAGVRCDRVVHVAFPTSSMFGKSLPLDVFAADTDDMYDGWDEDDGEDSYPVEHVSERCRVGTGAAEVATVRQSAIGQEIDRRLVEMYGARKRVEGRDDAARGAVVALLDAMRRCLAVEVEVEVEVDVGRSGEDQKAGKSGQGGRAATDDRGGQDGTPRPSAIWRLMTLLTHI